MEDIEQYVRYSPFEAALEGRDESAKADLYLRFSKLPDEVADTLTGTDTAEHIQAWEAQGIFPPSHSSAVAKLIALSIFGIIQPAQITNLLQKLNLDSVTATGTNEAIMTIVGPALSYIEGYTRPLNMGETVVSPAPTPSQRMAMPELPPLTQKIPPVGMGPDSSKTPARNIIDLRKQQPEL